MKYNKIIILVPTNLNIVHSSIRKFSLLDLIERNEVNVPFIVLTVQSNNKHQDHRIIARNCIPMSEFPSDCRHHHPLRSGATNIRWLSLKKYRSSDMETVAIRNRLSKKNPLLVELFASRATKSIPSPPPKPPKLPGARGGSLSRSQTSATTRAMMSRHCKQKVGCPQKQITRLSE